MYIILLQITALLAVVILPLLAVRKKFRKRSKPTTFKYKIDTNTEYARYAINEDGFLEEITEGKLSKHKH
ncbi:hypothetical protein [Mucilaginibacter sp. SP1R1]|uniref:hypothetical protein n=1 Tax=Mucilaginibacter sp. SP1R1 TaxID=2723091 RepID=UPI0016156858|nr:hypothetical protein [Mucilaginibacter sp. SP1R1]MBB6147944.1 hypothetical protein [Mucilaginibacter sp. SP1R1]